MEIPSKYSNSNSKKEELNNSNSNSKNTPQDLFVNLADVIPVDEYMPFYVAKLKKLGSTRFIELANKARRGDNPARLFFWMLKNNELVR